MQIITISTLVLISLIASEILTHYDQSLAFFLSLTRFWEIGLGSIIYMLTRSYNFGYNKMSSEIFAYVGIILLIFPIFLYSSKTMFPGFAALPPTVGTALIILFARDNTFVGILLKMKLLRAFGLISYSLYLSHHVVFSLSLNVGKALETTALKFFAISISIIIAIFSYFLIERPARYAKVNKVPYSLLMIALCFIFAAFGYYLHKSHGLEKFKMSRLSNIRIP